MKINSLVLLIALIAVPFCSAINICSDKSIMDDNGILKNNQSDLNYAYNEAASCASLTTSDSESTICCYIKLKFKNELLDETFTQKGCAEVEISTLQSEDPDFDDFLDQTEADIEEVNGGENSIDVKSLSIDCSSKYLQLAGLALLFFFL